MTTSETDEPILYGHSPLDGGPIYNILAFGELMQDPRRIVGRTRLTWKQKRFVVVSTVGVLTVDPVMNPFETLLLGPTHLLPDPLSDIGWDDIGGQYATRDEAETGHRAWCRLVAGWPMYKGRHTVTWHEETHW